MLVAQVAGKSVTTIEGIGGEQQRGDKVGVKAVAEIPMDGVAPAVANAVYDAVGVWLTQIPLTPERVWRAMANF